MRAAVSVFPSGSGMPRNITDTPGANRSTAVKRAETDKNSNSTKPRDYANGFASGKSGFGSDFIPRT